MLTAALSEREIKHERSVFSSSRTPLSRSLSRSMVSSGYSNHMTECVPLCAFLYGAFYNNPKRHGLELRKLRDGFERGDKARSNRSQQEVLRAPNPALSPKLGWGENSIALAFGSPSTVPRIPAFQGALALKIMIPPYSTTCFSAIRMRLSVDRHM